MEYEIVFITKERIGVFDLRYLRNQVSWFFGYDMHDLLVLDKQRLEELVSSEDKVNFILIDNLFADDRQWGDKNISRLRERFPESAMVSLSSVPCEESLYDIVVHRYLYDEEMKELAKMVGNQKNKPRD